MREIMTTEDVAAYLELETDTVHRLIREGKLGATQVDGAYRISHEALEAFLIANRDRPNIREAIFRRFMEVAERNPGVNSDDVLEELEREDEARKAKARSKH